MRAAVCTGYGPPEVFRLRQVDPPRPKPNEVCIRVFATAVTASDCIVRGLKISGWRRLAIRLAYGLTAPRVILGMIVAGEVESVGRTVSAQGYARIGGAVLLLAT